MTARQYTVCIKQSNRTQTQEHYQKHTLWWVGSPPMATSEVLDSVNRFFWLLLLCELNFYNYFRVVFYRGCESHVGFGFKTQLVEIKTFGFPAKFALVISLVASIISWKSLFEVTTVLL